MRGPLLRFGSAALLAVAVGWVAGTGERHAAAQPALKPDPKKEKEKDPRSARAAASPFNFHVVRDAGPRLKAAREYLGFKDIPWNTVCPLLQNILDGPDSFYDPDENDPRGAVANRNWGGVQHEAEQILAKFPREGLEFYQQLYGQPAAALLADSVKNAYDVEGLKALTGRYFFTKAGAEGTALLASIQLERGDYADAARHFGRLMARPGADDYLTPRVLFRAATAFKRSPEKEHAALFADAADRLHKATARDGLTFGRKTYTADQLRAELDRPVGSVELSAAGAFATHRGNAHRNALSNAGPPFLLPAFTAVRLLDAEGNKSAADKWIAAQLDYLFTPDDPGRTNQVFPLPGFFPVATSDLVMFRQYDGVRAVALRDQVIRGKAYPAGTTVWASPTRYGLSQLIDPSPSNSFADDGAPIRERVEQWWTAYRTQGTKAAAAYLAENPLIGSLSHDGTNVYFLDDLALPPPPPAPTTPFAGVQPGAQPNLPRSLEPAVRAGKLVAAEIASGGLVRWELGRLSVPAVVTDPPLTPLTEEAADTATSAFRLCQDAVFLAPPLPLNGRLYVPIDQSGYVRVLCLDPTRLENVVVTSLDADAKPPVPKRAVHQFPTLVWSVKLGRAGVALPNSPARRTQGAFLAAGDGILVCPTNSGAVVGIDLMSRRLLWGHVYKEPVAQQPTVTKAGAPLPGGIARVAMPEALPADRWRASAPVVVGNRVVVTGFDSDVIDCLDLRTGRLLWRARRQPTDLYLGAVLGDTLMVVGKEAVRGYKVGGETAGGDRSAAWTVPLGTAAPTGHGAAGKSAYYIPVRHEAAKAGADGKGGARVLEIWGVGPDGAVASKTQARAPTAAATQFGIGNLVFQDGLVVAQSAAELAVFPQLEEKRAEMDRRLKANPNDPEGLLARGDLLQDEGKLKEAVADYKAAERNPPAAAAEAEGFRRRVRERLHRSYTELLRQNFAASEGYLEEYAALCESYLEADETADDPEGHRAKVADRRRQYLSLLAKGREGQGRLDEAFDNYLALAQLGADQLQPDPDEPAVLRRADVAARGRIQAMIQRAGPDARKSLEGRVATEWAAVKGGNDLPRLREFVAVFGPYFPVGAEAELLLADRLTATNDEDDARAAQLHLHRVRSTAAEPALRARATADLAAVMVKAGLLDEAVRLHLQLGAEFKGVVVRDGKTGADYLTDLLTDRRLLPYLEPARYPLPTRVRAEEKQGGGGGGPHTHTEIDPAGDFLPEFRRYRFALDMNTGNGMWAVRGVDRATDVERYKFTDLQPFQYGGVAGTGRAFHAGGRVLVAQVGTMLYGYDLARRSQAAAWKLNMAADPPANMGLSRIVPAQDEVEIMYQDGTKITIRFTGVVARAEYVCVLTRDGLEAFDPTDRNKKFWTRRYVPERTHVYGDDRHVTLVEVGADRRPTGVRVLRASDGGVVDGAPDPGTLGATLSAARMYKVYGRTALLAEGADDEPKVLRLIDLATGADVWRREYDPRAVPVKSHDPEVAGMVRPTGEVDLVDPHTGRPLGAFKLDADRLADHLGRCRSAQLFADADRFYLVLDRDPARGAGMVATLGTNTQLRTAPVNGPMYCFRRATGERAWYADHHFENQVLILERFADLPVLVAAQSGIRAGVGGTEFRAVVVEKERGLLRLAMTTPYDGSTFQFVNVEPRTRTVEFLKTNTARPMRVVVMPDDR